MSKEYSKTVLVGFLRQALDTQIECLRDFYATDRNQEDLYELRALEILRSNIDCVSTKIPPKQLLCFECRKKIRKRYKCKQFVMNTNDAAKSPRRTGE